MVEWTAVGGSLTADRRPPRLEKREGRRSCCSQHEWSPGCAGSNSEGRSRKVIPGQVVLPEARVHLGRLSSSVPKGRQSSSKTTIPSCVIRVRRSSCTAASLVV